MKPGWKGLLCDVWEIAYVSLASIILMRAYLCTCPFAYPCVTIRTSEKLQPNTAPVTTIKRLRNDMKLWCFVVAVLMGY